MWCVVCAVWTEVEGEGGLVQWDPGPRRERLWLLLLLGLGLLPAGMPVAAAAAAEAGWGAGCSGAAGAGAGLRAGVRRAVVPGLSLRGGR